MQLFQVARKMTKAPDDQTIVTALKASFAERAFPFRMALPSVMIDPAEMSINNVWPLKGDALSIKSHYWPGAGLPAGQGADATFPPGGQALCVSTPNNPPVGDDGEFKRLNIDTIYAAWLSAWQDVMSSQDAPQKSRRAFSSTSGRRHRFLPTMS